MIVDVITQTPSPDVFRKKELPTTIEADKLHFTQIFQMNRAEQANLTQAVNEHGHSVRVFVHPFWDSGNSADKKAYLDAFWRVLASPNPKSLPIIIFEEQDKIAATQDLIQKQLGNIDRGIYFVPTQPDWSEPRPSPGELNDFRENEKLTQKHWSQLINIFKVLNIQTIWIGGQNLFILKQNQPTEQPDNWQRQMSAAGYPLSNTVTIEQCVGEAVARLSGDFKIELSGMAFPSNRVKVHQVLQGQS